MILKDIRREFQKGALSKKSVDANPFKQFNVWISEAKDNKEIIDSTAFSVSTISKDNRPHSRMVLLKDVTEKGFIFFTNYDSKKGIDINQNPNASFLFYWDQLERQVRIEGKLEKIRDSDSDKYYQSRPYGSRIGAWASEQSKELVSRAELELNIAKYIAKYPMNPPKPVNWGGYILIPDYFEFWQGRKSRIHDRIVYQLIEDNWKIVRLSP